MLDDDMWVSLPINFMAVAGAPPNSSVSSEEEHLIEPKGVQLRVPDGNQLWSGPNHVRSVVPSHHSLGDGLLHPSSHTR
jgi:hypothetical protein